MISVIIPVYNASSFLEEAVKSTIDFSEVNEVILVEDGSKDDSLRVCFSLVERFPKVRLLRHENGLNRGAGASRNLGVKNAYSEYVSFLDADDIYLPNRFSKDVTILENKKIDGVYSIIGSFSDSGKSMQRVVTGIPYKVKPNSLFSEILFNSHGINTLGFTVKKECILALNGFNNELKLHQDTELWLRLAYHYRLVGSSVDQVVALRREHRGNRISGKNSLSKLRLNSVLLRYYSSFNIEGEIKNLLIRKHLDSVYKTIKYLKPSEKGTAIIYLLRDIRFYFKYFI